MFLFFPLVCKSLIIQPVIELLETVFDYIWYDLTLTARGSTLGIIIRFWRLKFIPALYE